MENFDPVLCNKKKMTHLSRKKASRWNKNTNHSGENTGEKHPISSSTKQGTVDYFMPQLQL